MRFFSRIVFICNLCFIIVLILHVVRVNGNAHGAFDGRLGFQPIVGTIAILGYLVAIFLNAIFLLLSFYWIKRKKITAIPRWLVITNVCLLPVQVYYLFFM